MTPVHLTRYAISRNLTVCTVPVPKPRLNSEKTFSLSLTHNDSNTANGSVFQKNDFRVKKRKTCNDAGFIDEISGRGYR
jgi:hypothetical protein